jgi:acyl-coenzyme A thioesterase PaaI-like protein
MPEVWFTDGKKITYTISGIAGGLVFAGPSNRPDRKEVMRNDLHPNCFACGSKNGAGLQLKFDKDEDGTVFGNFFADPKFEGYSGIIHGGIIATLLDSVMTHCLFMNDIPALTGRLSIKYSVPIRTGTVVRLEANIVDQFHEMFILEGKAWVDGKRVASAEARYRSMKRSGKETTPFSSKGSYLENKLIGNILREYPQTAGIMERYFGGQCLEKPGFKIQTLGMACILFGVDQRRFLKELEGLRH